MQAAVHLEASSARFADIALHWRDVPILINSFNRLSCLRGLIRWLMAAGHRRIYVIDNNSTYAPLRSFLAELEDDGSARVVRLDRNVGHLAVWREDLLARLGIDTEYVYTDPDVVPAACCPGDVVARLQAVLADNPEVAVAGLGLRLDDLPRCYRFRSEAIAWERQFWLAPAASGLFHAPIDTTFALYRPGSGHCLGRPAIRTGWPCVAAHTSWYADDGAPSEEDLWYAQAAAGTSHWAIPKLPEWLEAAARQHLASAPRLISVTPPGVVLPGYRSLEAAGAEPFSADGAYVLDSLSRLRADPALRGRLGWALKGKGRLVIHERGAGGAEAGAILRGEAPWLENWHLRRVVASGGWTAEELVAGRCEARLDDLMLHLEPRPAGRYEHDLARLEFRSDGLDRWPGFAPV
jgi:hypothetical protein